MLETASHRVAAARSKLDHKVEEPPLNLSVTSDRPSVVEIPSPSHAAVTDPTPETKSEETTEKEEPAGPSHPPLLILDLNGCILYREYVPGSYSKIVKPRPYLDDLFEYVFSSHPKDNRTPNWELMIWSSAQPKNVDLMLEAVEITKRPKVERSTLRGFLAAKNQLNDISNRLESLSIDKSNPDSSKETTKKPIKRLVMDVWNREFLDLSSQDYNRKVSTTKDLRKVWDQCSWTDPATGEKLKWDAHNTVIVDDSPGKLSLQPESLCLVEEFKGDPNDKAILELIEILKSIRDEPNMTEALKKIKEKKVKATSS